MLATKIVISLSYIAMGLSAAYNMGLSKAKTQLSKPTSALELILISSSSIAQSRQFRLACRFTSLSGQPL